VRIAELPVEFKESGGADVRDVLKLRDGEAKLRDAITNARTWTPGGERAALSLVTLDSAVQRFIADLGTEQPLWTTSLPDVDDALSGGVLPGEMVIIAGRPSHGKTVAGLQMLDGLAKTVPVLMVSEEMSLPALAQRSLSGITGLNSRDWAAQKDRLSREACQHYAGRKPFLVAESCGTADRAIEAIARAKEQYQIGAVAVDYVQMLRGNGDGRYEQVSDTSTRLKQAAVQYGVLLVAICQLNRGVEEGNKPRAPKMSDLRDSGQLEQDADVILFVEWLHRSAPQEHAEDAYRITVAKNRNRGIKRSVIDCVFIAERQVLRPKALAYQEEAATGTPTRTRNGRPQKYSEFEGFEGNGGEF
jgi:replicative DNA helicase